MENENKIRPLKLEDAKQITDLSSQLGYSIDPETIKDQISSILSKADHLAYVAVQQHEIIGYIHAFTSYRLTSKNFIEIAALIVNKNFRRKGVGKALVQHLEKKTPDHLKIRVRCNHKREEAHIFYQKLRYSEIKNQKVFVKNNNHITDL